MHDGSLATLEDVVKHYSTVSPDRLHSDGTPLVRPLGEIVLKSTYPFAARDAGRLNDGDQFSRLPSWPLSQIKCPTLIIHGTADTNVPFAHAQFAHEQIAGSRLEAFQGGDHFISVTYGTKIDALVAQFVAEHVLNASGGQ